MHFVGDDLMDVHPNARFQFVAGEDCESQSPSGVAESTFGRSRRCLQFGPYSQNRHSSVVTHGVVVVTRCCQHASSASKFVAGTSASRSVSHRGSKLPLQSSRLHVDVRLSRATCALAFNDHLLPHRPRRCMQSQSPSNSKGMHGASIRGVQNQWWHLRFESMNQMYAKVKQRGPSHPFSACRFIGPQTKTNRKMIHRH